MRQRPPGPQTARSCLASYLPVRRVLSLRATGCPHHSAPVARPVPWPASNMVPHDSKLAFSGRLCDVSNHAGLVSGVGCRGEEVPPDFDVRLGSGYAGLGVASGNGFASIATCHLVWQVNGVIGYYTAPRPPLFPFPRPAAPDGGKGREGDAYVWRTNSIHPWHKATGVSRMGQHAVVPPTTPMLLVEGLFALWRVFRRVDTVCGWQRRAPAR